MLQIKGGGRPFTSLTCFSLSVSYLLINNESYIRAVDGAVLLCHTFSVCFVHGIQSVVHVGTLCHCVIHVFTRGKNYAGGLSSSQIFD